LYVPPKTLTDLLKAHPQEDLEALAESLKAEIAKLQDQLRFVEGAIEPRTRRGGSPQRSGLSRDDYIPIIASFGRPVLPGDVTAAIQGRGIDISSNAVRTTMSRLVEDERLLRTVDGRYVLASQELPQNGSGARLSADLSQDRESESALRFPTEG